jgi:hypothetical protein
MWSDSNSVVAEWLIIMIGPGGLLIVVPHLFICCPSFSFMGGAKKEIAEWGCEKYFCRVTCWAWCSKSISTSTQYVTLDNQIKCLSLGFYILGSPTNKTVTGTAYMWGLLIANHLDQSAWSTNQKYWAAVGSNLLHTLLFWRCTPVLCL